MTDEPDPQADVPQATPDPARPLAVDTPVAKPLPKRDLLTRRTFLLGGFWTAMALIPVGLLRPSPAFLWPRGGRGFGGPVNVTPGRTPSSIGRTGGRPDPPHRRQGRRIDLRSADALQTTGISRVSQR